jgi:peptide chain release factor 3
MVRKLVCALSIDPNRKPAHSVSHTAASQSNSLSNSVPPTETTLDLALTPKSTPASKLIRKEVARRRTFGIISHPDAGKTTLTERLLLLGGAIQTAGDVRAKKTGRAARSDWMAIEQQRGISVTSSVMSFAYSGRILNLLDTPGHHDFSEDTYRVLTAVDSALMVIDSVKGVEAQTRKLMEVCRLRATPVLTFINKLDREGLDPFDLLADIEEHLGIAAAPVTWPIGTGTHFRGVYHLIEHSLHLIDPESGRHVVIPITGPDDPAIDQHVGNEASKLREDIELLSGAGTEFDKEAYLAEKQTPVMFGSALSGFGVESLLDLFVEIAPAPLPREAVAVDGSARTVSPGEEPFTGVVFKIQANMDKNHRDRIAFVRVCSGRFERGIKLRHQRLERDLRVPNASTFFAGAREGVDHAFAGDIIGIPNHGTIRVGDTFTEGEPFRFIGVPSFAPEFFRKVRVDNALRMKQLDKGLRHLTEEGTIQLYRPLLSNDYVLGAVGVLQFEVVAQRLATEYGVEVRLDSLSYTASRWVDCADQNELESFRKKEASTLALDAEGKLAYLASSDWWLNRMKQNWPKIEFLSATEMV